MISERKTWKMMVADCKHTVVLGADNFSCGWTNQKVARNYRETADGEGNVAAVENNRDREPNIDANQAYLDWLATGALPI